VAPELHGTDDRRVITVLLADDNAIVRAGVGAMLSREPDIEVVATAEDRDQLLAAADRFVPQVLVTDIRMPPSFQREGIDAAREVRKRHPGTGVVILSQYDDPEYAVALLAEGSAGYGYLLKQHVADGDQLARAVRAVATGGTSLDPVIVDALMNPVSDEATDAGDERLLRMVAEGLPVKAIAMARRITPEAASTEVEQLFLRLAQQAGAGGSDALRRLRMLHQAIVDREEQGETLSRMLPSGLATKLRAEGATTTGVSELVDVTVVMSDVRGYTTIAERTDPARLASQLNEHRAAMNAAILGASGTVMQFVGDAVMAVFGAPVALPDHPARALEAALAMHAAQDAVNAGWAAEGLPPFPLGIGISTGTAAAALLGSDEHLEYTLVGDTVNLSQRLQQWAEPGQTVLSEPTWRRLDPKPDAVELEAATVKGRERPVQAWRIDAQDQARTPRSDAS
jgi:class 3 adenylate cyclase/DNA-binding NarL/FixJ family response regulator